MNFNQELLLVTLSILTLFSIYLLHQDNQSEIEIGAFILFITVIFGWLMCGTLVPLEIVYYDTYLTFAQSSTSAIGLNDKGVVVWQSTEYNDVVKCKGKSYGKFVASNYVNLYNCSPAQNTQYKLVESY